MKPFHLMSKLSLMGLILVAAFVIAILYFWWAHLNQLSSENNQFPNIAIEKMGHLVATKVNYADVIEFTQKRSADIPWTNWELVWGSTKVLLIVKGDCAIGTDLRQAEYVNVNTKSHTFDLKLKTPKAIYARINHSPKKKGGSYLYGISNQGLELITPNSSNRITAINNAMSFAEKQILLTCNQKNMIVSAKNNTEQVLNSVFQSFGWKAKYSWE